MKRINSFTDVAHIISNKLDVLDNKGCVVSFRSFMKFTLNELLTIVFNSYGYKPI